MGGKFSIGQENLNTTTYIIIPFQTTYNDLTRNKSENMSKCVQYHPFLILEVYDIVNDLKTRF